MKPWVPEKVGYVGVGLACFGLVLAGIAALTAGVSMLLMVAGFFYLVGAFLTVGAFGYDRRSKSFLFIRVIRLTFAAMVMLAFFKVMSNQ